MVASIQETVASRDELLERRKELERRLTLGWQWIDEAIAAGRDVRSAERRWINLLVEYEQVCTSLAQAA